MFPRSRNLRPPKKYGKRSLPHRFRNFASPLSGGCGSARCGTGAPACPRHCGADLQVCIPKVSNDERPSAVFQVYADKKLLAESPKLTWRGAGFWHFDVDLPPKTRNVRLVVTDAGDGIAADHADWVDAGFVTQEK